MPNAFIASVLIASCIALTSCKPRGIIELSRSDTQRCYQILAQDGELLTAVAAALDDYAAKLPDSHARLLTVRTQCREHLEQWDTLVRELYEKYGLSEDAYRLDVFRGRFMRKGMA